MATPTASSRAGWALRTVRTSFTMRAGLAQRAVPTRRAYFIKRAEQSKQTVRAGRAKRFKRGQTSRFYLFGTVKRNQYKMWQTCSQRQILG